MAVKIPSLARIFLLSAFLSSCVYQSNALCNGAAALLCCLNVVPATDPLAIAALALAGTTALPTQQIGLVCVPALAETGILWYVAIYVTNS